MDLRNAYYKGQFAAKTKKPKQPPAHLTQEVSALWLLGYEDFEKGDKGLRPHDSSAAITPVAPSEFGTAKPTKLGAASANKSEDAELDDIWGNAMAEQTAAEGSKEDKALDDLLANAFD